MTQENMKTMMVHVEEIMEKQKELMMPGEVSDTMIKKVFTCWDKLRKAYNAMEDVLDQMVVEQIGAGYEQLTMMEG